MSTHVYECTECPQSYRGHPGRCDDCGAVVERKTIVRASLGPDGGAY